MEIKYKAIGIIKSPFKATEGMPIQSASASGVRGEVIVNEEYLEGLSDLDGFSHIVLLFHFHQSKKFKLKVKPYMDNVERGVFATRAPSRPNSIGLSVVKLIGIEGNKLIIENVDILDGTPLLDIKPYIYEMDNYDNNFRYGWITGKINKIKGTKSDSRFFAK